jgi:starch synthase
VKTGGLADVAGALPAALAGEGVEMRILVPGYPALAGIAKAGEAVLKIRRLNGGPAHVVAARAEGLDLLILDAPHLYDRPGNPYLGPKGRDWPDNHLRFGALSQVAARIAREGAGGWRPDLLHAHDWQAGLAPAYGKLGKGKAPPSVITIHNIAFQGVFPAAAVPELGLPESGFTIGGFEYYGRLSFLKAGLIHADRITTVSPTYARELTMPEFGMGLEGVIASRRGVMRGIVNGVDLDVWNPGTDSALAATYTARSLGRRGANRAALEERFALDPAPEAPLFCVVSRLSQQKGLDLLLEALPRLLSRGASLAVLGSGDAQLEDGFQAAAKANPGRVGVVIGYDEELSHLVQGGADSIVIPSRFEPCGLTQLYGLRYGCLPLVARTGGLADTVIDANEAAISAGVATGFQFAPPSAGALGDALDRACDAFADQTLWRGMMRRAMGSDVGWSRSAAAYRALYDELVDK